MGDRRYENIRLNAEQKEELSRVFKTVEPNWTGYIFMRDLGDALTAVGIKIAPYEVRKMVSEWESRTSKSPIDGKLQLYEFEKLYKDLKSKELATTFKSMVSRKDNLVTHGGMSETSSEGTTHTVRQEEQVAFSHWVNTNLGHDKDLQHLLPIDREGMDLYDKVKDGILLCKIINFSCPDTIDERALNTRNLNVYTMHENLVLAINSAMAIGCNVVNIGADDLAKGKPHLVLGLLWQIIRIGLFNQVDLQHCPGLVKLLKDGERLEDMMKLSTEAILLRWVNYHLSNAGYPKQISNFTTDIMDSLPYLYLIHEIAPKDCGTSLFPTREPDLERRAELMLREADKIRCRAFLSPSDVVSGNYKLNVAFVANMFNTHPGFVIEENGAPENYIDDSAALVEETREERTYRNWMNSMGVSPHVNWLYSDLCDGIVIFQLYDIIKPGLVDWVKVHKQFTRLKAFMEKIENCNYAVVLGKTLKFSLVGIAGQDINDGNPTLTLALVWQLMRAYTLSILCNLTNINNNGTPVSEKEIIKWVNDKLKSCGKGSKLSSFQDSSISDGKVVLDLVDSIKRGSVDYGQVKEGVNNEAKLCNAKYAISMSRKLGAKIYALPEDIVEVKPKMVMTVFACLMGRDHGPPAEPFAPPEGIAHEPTFEPTPMNHKKAAGFKEGEFSSSPTPPVWCSPRTYNQVHNNQHVIFSSSSCSSPTNMPRASPLGSPIKSSLQLGHRVTPSPAPSPEVARTVDQHLPPTPSNSSSSPVSEPTSQHDGDISAERNEDAYQKPCDVIESQLGDLEDLKIGSNEGVTSHPVVNGTTTNSTRADVPDNYDEVIPRDRDFVTREKLATDGPSKVSPSPTHPISPAMTQSGDEAVLPRDKHPSPSPDLTSWIKGSKLTSKMSRDGSLKTTSPASPNHVPHNVQAGPNGFYRNTSNQHNNSDVDDDDEFSSDINATGGKTLNGHPSPVLTNRSFVN